MIKHRYTD